MIPQSLLKPPLLGAGAYKVTELLNAGATASARNRDSNKEDIFTGLTSRIAPSAKLYSGFSLSKQRNCRSNQNGTFFPLKIAFSEFARAHLWCPSSSLRSPFRSK
jgi:hypothetical protein